MEQQRCGESVEVECRNQKDHVWEPVDGGSRGPRRPDERQGDLQPEEGELLRLRDGIPESTSFGTVNVYEFRSCPSFHLCLLEQNREPFCGCNEVRPSRLQKLDTAEKEP